MLKIIFYSDLLKYFLNLKVLLSVVAVIVEFDNEYIINLIFMTQKEAVHQDSLLNIRTEYLVHTLDGPCVII
jgi:hypothetical protein